MTEAQRENFLKSSPEEILAAMVAAVFQERERCAKIAEKLASECGYTEDAFRYAYTNAAGKIRSGENINEPPASFVSSESKL